MLLLERGERCVRGGRGHVRHVVVVGVVVVVGQRLIRLVYGVNGVRERLLRQLVVVLADHALDLHGEYGQIGQHELFAPLDVDARRYATERFEQLRLQQVLVYHYNHKLVKERSKAK